MPVTAATVTSTAAALAELLLLALETLAVAAQPTVMIVAAQPTVMIVVAQPTVMIVAAQPTVMAAA